MDGSITSSGASDGTVAAGSEGSETGDSDSKPFTCSGTVSVAAAAAATEPATSSISWSTSMTSFMLVTRGGVRPRNREVLSIAAILASKSACLLAIVATIPPTCAPTKAFRSFACS